MIGAIKPVRNAAVAYDGKKALAMLRYRPDEALSSILKRLDAAIAAAQASIASSTKQPSLTSRFELPASVRARCLSPRQIGMPSRKPCSFSIPGMRGSIKIGMAEPLESRARELDW